MTLLYDLYHTSRDTQGCIATSRICFKHVACTCSCHLSSWHLSHIQCLHMMQCQTKSAYHYPHCTKAGQLEFHFANALQSAENHPISERPTMPDQVGRHHIIFIAVLGQHNLNSILNRMPLLIHNKLLSCFTTHSYQLCCLTSTCFNTSL